MDLLSTGMVLDDINQTGCVPVSQCTCLYNGTFYAPGTSYSTDCTKWYVLGSPSKTLTYTVFLRICGLVRSQATMGRSLQFGGKITGMLFLGLVYNMSFFLPVAHALEVSGAARKSHALAPAQYWEAPTSPHLMKGSTQYMGTAAMC